MGWENPTTPESSRLAGSMSDGSVRYEGRAHARNTNREQAKWANRRRKLVLTPVSVEKSGFTAHFLSRSSIKGTG
jgi:hypothetical protein